MYSIIYKKQALKNLENISALHRIRLVKSINSLGEDPYRGKKLQGVLEGIYSLRVWPYRILYQIGKRSITVVILEIGHRQGIYK